MRRGKRGPALFELIEESPTLSPKVSLGWWRRIKRPRSESSLAAGGPDVRESSSGDSWGLRRANSDEDGGRIPWMRFEGDRIQISLSSVGAASALFVFALALIVAFGLGNRRGESRGLRRAYAAATSPSPGGAVDEVQAVRTHPPATHLIADLVERGPGSAGVKERLPSGKGKEAGVPELQPAASPSDGATPSPPVWVRDHTYIVAQEMPASALADATAAAEFLGRHGIPTTVVKRNGRSLLLITTKGYNHKDPAQKRQSEALLQQIRSLGLQYYASGGGYKLEGYFKTLKEDTW